MMEDSKVVGLETLIPPCKYVLKFFEQLDILFFFFKRQGLGYLNEFWIFLSAWVAIIYI
jgi:hypothetical protein